MTEELHLSSAKPSRSPADLIVRSPVMGWIFALAAAASLASGVLTAFTAWHKPSAFSIGISLACWVYSALCIWCWRERRYGRRSVMTVGLFAGATITFIAAAAVPQRAGVNTVGFMVLPVFMFMITVLGQRRLSLAMLAYTAALFVGVAGHHMVQVPEAAAIGGALSQTLIAASLILAFALLGDQIAQVVDRQVQLSRSTAQRYRALFDRLPVAAMLLQDHRVVEHNEAAATLFAGDPRASILGQSCIELLPEAERAATEGRLEQAASMPVGQGLPLRDMEMLGHQGQTLHVSVTAVAVDPDRRTILSLIIDRSSEDLARRELRKTQRLVEALFRASSHTMAVSDRETGEFLLVNPAFAQAAGMTPQEMVGRTSLELGITRPDKRRELLARLGEAGVARDVSLRVRSADGIYREQRHSVTATEIDGRAVLVSVGHDVTDENRRERELGAILAATPAAVSVVRHGRVTAASAQYERLMGLAPGQAVGRAYDAHVGGPQAMKEIANLYNQALRKGEVVRFEHPLHRADGRVFPGLLTGRLIKPGAADGFGMVWVFEDLTERRQREDQLARAKADAEAASRAKTGFLATMSHEIRTPLNGILGLIELVNDPQLDPASRQNYLQMMTESSHALQEIVSDVLDLSRIESGRLVLDVQSFELRPWLDSIRSSFFALAEAKGLVLEVQARQDDLGWVMGDPTRLRQIVSNYLSNALKFTLKGRIAIGLERLDDRRIRLEVVDTGIGIEPQALSGLFRPYAQVGPASTGARSSGLGLSICRELAEAMGGTAGARSEHGLGSCFWAEVELPILAQGQEPASTSGEAPRLDGLRVLVVDDNRINLVVARQMLQRAGAVVEVAEGGEQSLERVDEAHARGEDFDVVLMDVQMPGMDGLAALAALRTRPHGQALPVLAASAAVTTDEVDLTRIAGFDGFVSKPLEWVTLVKAVARASVARTVGF